MRTNQFLEALVPSPHGIEDVLAGEVDDGPGSAGQSIPLQCVPGDDVGVGVGEGVRVLRPRHEHHVQTATTKQSAQLTADEATAAAHHHLRNQ